MNFLKRFFGWGGEEETSSEERERLGQQQQRVARQRAAAAAAAAQWGPTGGAPLVVEAPSGDGGVQGLDWFGQSMLRDSDGDCAHSFLEEASKRQQQKQQPQKQQQRGKAAHAGGPPRPRSGGGGGKAQQQQEQAAALQCKSRCAQRAGPSDLLLDRGNVYVVPHDS